MLYKSYKLKGDYVKALEYYELYKTTNDSLVDVEKAKAIANLQAIAEVERKEKEIVLLNKNKELDQKVREGLAKDLELQRIEAERQRNAKLALERQAEADKLWAMARQETDKRKQDSLLNLAQKKQLEADKLKAMEQSLKAENRAKILEIQKEKEAKEQQQIINYLVLGGFCAVLVLALFIYRAQQSEKRAKEKVQMQNQEILQKNEEIEQQKEELHQTLQVTEMQRAEIQKKNEDITASINYALRIQNAIIPKESELQKHFDCFVFFRPRDIVSGDFYWFAEKEVKNEDGTTSEKYVLAVIDCSGHGVPGAFMTMIGSEILNEVVQYRAILEADQILNELHKRLHKALKQGEKFNRDSMDMVLLVIDKAQKLVQFAGAKNSLIYIQNNTLQQIKGDKMPIGGLQKEAERVFTKHLIDIHTPTTFYLFTDGYQDQFGGANRNKFMISQMKEVFLEIHQKAMQEQRETLLQRINTWMQEANENQIDDILVVGLQLQ